MIRAGQPVVLNAPKHRVLLATLLIGANRTLSIDQLTERLWGERPPARARKAIQVYVTRLRQLLGDDLIVTRPDGYQLPVDPDQLDLSRFNRLTDTARQAARAGDADVELRRLTEALACWRGPALADVPSESLQREVVAQLAESRLRATERRMQLALDLGHHRDVITDLVQLTKEHPWQESFWMQLILALYRSDRLADALDTCRTVHRMFRDELGVDPSEQLRQLPGMLLSGQVDPGRELSEPHEAVLSGLAIEPDREGLGSNHPRWHVVCQLPAVTGDFVGRAYAMDAVEHAPLTQARAAQGVSVAVVSGVAGVGKTTLAIQVAHRLRAHFPDGQLYSCLNGGCPAPRDPAEILAELLHALGVRPVEMPDGLAARAALFRSRVADRRVLVVLDDAASVCQVEQLLPGTPGSAVLITSRRALAELPGWRHRLEPLTTGEGVSLLRRLVDDRHVTGYPDAATELVDLCGGLPLAVRIVAARLRLQRAPRPDVLAERLRDQRGRLDELASGPLRVRAGLELSYSALEPQARTAFRRMGLLTGTDFAAWTLGVLTDGGDGERLVEQLTAEGLLESVGVDEVGQTRYRPHDLVALYARELAAQEPTAITQTAMDRLLDALIEIGHDVYRRAPRTTDGLAPGEGSAAGAAPTTNGARHAHDPTAWVHAERRRILDTIGSACELGRYAKAAVLADQVIPTLAARGQFGPLLRARELIRDAARAAGDELTAWRAECSRADTLLSVRLNPAADSFAECAQAFHRVGASRELVHSLTGLAFARCHQGRAGDLHAVEAIRVAETSADPASLALALRTHAETLILTSQRPHVARSQLERALGLCTAPATISERRQILLRLVDVAIAVGDLDRARSLFDDARELTDHIHSTVGVAWLCLLGSRLQLAKGNLTAAIDDARRSRDLMTEWSDPRGLATTSTWLAELHLRAGHPRDAVDLLEATISTLDPAAAPLIAHRAAHLLDDARQAAGNRARPDPIPRPTIPAR